MIMATTKQRSAQTTAQLAAAKAAKVTAKAKAAARVTRWTEKPEDMQAAISILRDVWVSPAPCKGSRIIHTRADGAIRLVDFELRASAEFPDVFAACEAILDGSIAWEPAKVVCAKPPPTTKAAIY